MRREVVEGEHATPGRHGVDNSLRDGSGVEALAGAVFGEAAERGGELGVGFTLARRARGRQR